MAKHSPITPAIPADPKHMAAKSLELALAQMGSAAHAEDTARRHRVIAAMTPAERAAFDRMVWGDNGKPCMSLSDWTGHSSYPSAL